MSKTLISWMLYVIGGLILTTYFNIEIESFIDFCVWVTGIMVIGLGGLIANITKD